jgi:pimeloyl-ACP methyl ester carboxylesterase
MEKNFFSLSFLLLLICLCACNDSDTSKAQTEASSEPEVRSLFINGDSIHYVDVGKGDPVVFVHGGAGDYRTFEKQMDEFTKSHRVIAYSRRFAYPNQQTIQDSSATSVASHARDLAELLKALNLGPVNLYGHSYGADIALVTAANHPELVSSLILGEPFIPSLMQKVPGGDTILNNFLAKAFGPVAEAIKSNNNEGVARGLITGVMGDSLYYDKLSQKDRDIMIANVSEIRAIVLGKDNFPVVGCDDVKKIKAPVLLLKGDKSPVIFSLMMEELNRCLSNREVATLTNTTHGLEYENPAEFNKTVLAFIDKH